MCGVVCNSCAALLVDSCGLSSEELEMRLIVHILMQGKLHRRCTTPQLS